MIWLSKILGMTYNLEQREYQLAFLLVEPYNYKSVFATRGESSSWSSCSSNEMARVPCPGRVWKSNVCLQKKKRLFQRRLWFLYSEFGLAPCLPFQPFRQVRTCPFLAAASTRARFTIALSCVVGVSGMARVSLTRLLREISACACSFPDILVAAVLLFLLGQLKQRSCIESGMCSQPATWRFRIRPDSQSKLESDKISTTNKSLFS